MSMKQITLDGRLGQDAKLMKTNGGKEYVRFSLANDSFVDGTNKTEWFDITCFDPYVVTKKFDYLKKGRYAIISGAFKSEVQVREGKVYLNNYVTANNVELPSFGGKKDDNEVKVSTYTGGTRSDRAVQEAAAPVQSVPEATQTAPQPQPVVSQQAPVGWSSDGDDLPF